jgi:hypothetical protein
MNSGMRATALAIRRASSDESLLTPKLKRCVSSRQKSQATAACDGDLRAAVRALIVANSFLESEVAELKKAVSHAYVRGRFRTYSG